jgi:HEAT repeat protein
MGDDTLKTGQAVQKYRDALNSSNPATRAEGIQNLILFSDPLTTDKSHPDIVTYIEKALTDNDPTVREAALRSLNLWDGDIPMQMLSRIVLNDQNPELRMHALSVLADRFDERAIPTLQQASHDPDSRVAQKASQLLEGFSP